jgi:hypothetical protein
MADCSKAEYLSGFSTNRKLRIRSLCNKVWLRLHGTRSFAGEFCKILPDVSKACIALVFRARVRVLTGGGTAILRNVENYLYNDTS